MAREKQKQQQQQKNPPKKQKQKNKKKIQRNESKTLGTYVFSLSFNFFPAIRHLKVH